jgi:3'-5' exoribonuclease
MRRFLCDCVAGDVLDDVFVVSNKQFASTKQGKPYVKAIVADRSQTINARRWDATRQWFDRLPEGGFVRLRCRVENYQENLQIVIEDAWDPKPGSYQLCDLIPHTTRDVPAMFARLGEMLGSISNRHLAALVRAYLDDEKLMADFRQAPAAMSFHHAFLGGLLEHTLNTVEVAEACCAFYPGLNRDLVIAGIFLHDIAKTWELTYSCAFGYSDGGQLIGHIVKSAMWVEEKRKVAETALGEAIPQPLIDVVQHIILSHHGVAEFGSPKCPATPEALAVHALENMDAKLTMALSACRGEMGAAAEGNWTEYMKAFSGKMYRPDVAPAEVAAQNADGLLTEGAEPGGSAAGLAPDAQGRAMQIHPQSELAAKPPGSVMAGNGSGAGERPRINNPLFESAPGPRK